MYLKDGCSMDDLAQRQQVRSRSGWGRRFVLHAILIFFAFVAIVPLYWALASSFMTLGETINRRWFPDVSKMVWVNPQWTTADGTTYTVPVPIHANYFEAWERGRFERYFLNSVIITFLTIVGMLLTSIPAAYAFAKIKFFGRDVLFSILLITLMVPESITLIPNFRIIRGDVLPLPLINTSAPYFELGGVSWVNKLPALTVPFIASAFSIFLLRQFFTTIPDELWEAARMDGAGHLRFLIQIATPIARPAITTVSLLTFIGSWNAFLWPLVVTTEERWRPIMVGLDAFMQDAGPELHLLMAGSMFAIVPILVVYFFTQKTFTEGVATSGLKG